MKKTNSFLSLLLTTLLLLNLFSPFVIKADDDNDPADDELINEVEGGQKEVEGGQEEEANDSFDVKTMLLLAIATSIDALAVGVSFAFMDVAILPAVSLIGVTTFVLSAIGIKIGHLFGSKYQKPAEIIGGLALISIGLKVLIQGLL